MVIKEGDFRASGREEEAHFLYHRRRDGTNKATCSLSWKGKLKGEVFMKLKSRNQGRYTEKNTNGGSTCFGKKYPCSVYSRRGLCPLRRCFSPQNDAKKRDVMCIITGRAAVPR